jgi:hypothetical protein
MRDLARSNYIAVNPSPAPSAPVAKTPDVAATPTSTWAIAGAIVIAGMPHLWQWLNGNQEARNTLTKTLLQNLTESYQQYNLSNEGFRRILNEVVERPTELTELNNQLVRDLVGEVADLRGQVLTLQRKVDNLAGIVVRQAQERKRGTNIDDSIQHLDS